MRKVYVDQLKAGLLLGKAIYNERGDVLLARGVALTDGFIESLQSHGYYTVYVMDGIADDIEPPDILSDRVRVATSKHLRDLFATIGSSVAEAGDGMEPAGTFSQLSMTSKPQVAQLYRDVESIVDEVAKAKTLSGVSWLKTHDNYTFEHSIEVTVASVMLGKRLNVPVHELHQLAMGALYHDIGKLTVPREILEKPNALTPEEFALVWRHPQAGYDMVRPLTGDSEIVARSVVRQHHERQDGSGYPDGLRGDNWFDYHRGYRPGDRMMTPAAEIVAVADVYSALASDRPFRPALSPVEIATTLQQLAGTHLNREIVTRFLSILPTYPVGTKVVVISDKLYGFRGIVSAVDAGDVHRPTVRIFRNSLGRNVVPFEVNTSKEPEIQLALAASHEWAIA